MPTKSKRKSSRASGTKPRSAPPRSRTASVAPRETSRERQRPKPPLPRQSQPAPGLEREMTPRPQFEGPVYRAAGKLSGKVALITGGDSGIGRAVALLFAREGADVGIIYTPVEEPDAVETRNRVEGEGRRAVLIPGDVTQPEFCREAVDR